MRVLHSRAPRRCPGGARWQEPGKVNGKGFGGGKSGGGGGNGGGIPAELANYVGAWDIKKTICFNCNEPGHRADSCPKPSRKDGKGKGFKDNKKFSKGTGKGDKGKGSGKGGGKGGKGKVDKDKHKVSFAGGALVDDDESSDSDSPPAKFCNGGAPAAEDSDEEEDVGHGGSRGHDVLHIHKEIMKMEQSLTKSKKKDGTPRYSKKFIKEQIEIYRNELFGEESE